MSLSITPLTLGEAFYFTAHHHRHHKRPPRFSRFAIGLRQGHIVVGCAIVGNPVARHLDDELTAEVTRLCVRDHQPNACSMLYGACWRAARAMGFRRLVTYTLGDESGVSLRAAGWKLIGECGGGTWSRSGRPRVDDHPTQTKLRWEAV